MKTYTRSFIGAALVAALVVLSGGSAFAQTVLASTTLSSAVSDTSGRLVVVASATGITAPASGTTPVLLLVDRELMRVLSLSGTSISVARGQDGTRAATHVSGATVWVAPPTAIYAYPPSGQCTRTNLATVPYIVGSTTSLGSEVGSLFDCMGVTSNGQWVQTNGTNTGQQVLGSTVASTAGVITGTGTYFKVSGTSAITGITAPAGIAPGFTIAIEPTAIFTWTAATNITLAGTAVVGKVLYFTWNGTKWAPSYIA
jgi:hypothetical protein